MPDRHPTPPRAVPATIDAHRVAAARPARTPVGGPVAAVAPAAPAVHAPARRPHEVADAEQARLLRTVDALRRLQATLSGAQQALDTVIVQVSGAVERETGVAMPGAAARGRVPVGRVTQRPAGAPIAAARPPRGASR